MLHEPEVALLLIAFALAAVSAVQLLEPDVALLQLFFEAPVAPAAILIQLNEPVALSLFVHPLASQISYMLQGNLLFLLP